MFRFPLSLLYIVIHILIHENIYIRKMIRVISRLGTVLEYALEK